VWALQTKDLFFAAKGGESRELGCRGGSKRGGEV